MIIVTTLRYDDVLGERKSRGPRKVELEEDREGVKEKKKINVHFLCIQITNVRTKQV